MLLSLRFLIDVCDVNSFEPTPQLEFASGDSQTMFFQLVDSSVDRVEQGFSPAGRRYIPSAGSSLLVTFANVSGNCGGCGSCMTCRQNSSAWNEDGARLNSRGPFDGAFNRYAAQPFIQDGSIWSVPVLSTDPLHGTISLKMQLIEPNRRLYVNFTPGVMLRVR